MLFQPNYCLGHPEKKLFLLSNFIFFGSKYTKKTFNFILKTASLVTMRFFSSEEADAYLNKSAFYAVIDGRNHGVYTDVVLARSQIDGIKRGMMRASHCEDATRYKKLRSTSKENNSTLWLLDVILVFYSTQPR